MESKNKEKNKEKIFKKELKKIDKILERIPKTYEPIPKFDCDSFRDFVYPALDECRKAKEIIEKSKVKEMHERPHPLIARHLGIQTRSSEDIKFYQGNIDILRNIVLDFIFNYLFNFGGNEEIEKKVEFVLGLKDPLTKETLQEKLKDFGLDEGHLERYVEGKVLEYGQRTAAVARKMEESLSLGEYEFGLLEKFAWYFNKIKMFKDRFDPREVYVFGKEGKPISLASLEEMAQNYALYGLNIIVKNLQNKPNMKDPTSVTYFLFDNNGLEEMDFIRKFVEKKAERDFYGLYLAGNGLSLPLKYKIEKDYEIICQTENEFREVIEKKQSELEKATKEAAGNADKKYITYLNQFMNLAQRYSTLLEEEEEDIQRALMITEPDYFVEKNAKEKKERPESYQLPLYEEYKELYDASLAKFVVDVKKEHIKKNREAWKNKI